MALTEELPIYKATYDLVLVVFGFVKNFNREYKYTIRNYLLIFIILFGQLVYAQQIEIQITGTNDKAFLSELSGEKVVAIDSLISNNRETSEKLCFYDIDN